MLLIKGYHQTSQTDLSSIFFCFLLSRLHRSLLIGQFFQLCLQMLDSVHGLGVGAGRARQSFHQAPVLFALCGYTDISHTL